MGSWLLLLLAAAATIAVAQPFWPHYPERKVQVLDGTWSFGYASAFDYEGATDPAALPTPETTSVPSAFDMAEVGYKGRRGTAFYRRTFESTPGVPVLLQFLSCSFTCRVWVDGALAGEHSAGGYTPFWLSVPASASATREIVVMADNRFNRTRSPLHTGGDFWHYGGLLRSVLVHEQPSTTFVGRVEVTTRDLAAGTIDVAVYLAGEKHEGPVVLELAFGAELAARRFKAQADASWRWAEPTANGQVVVLRSVAVPNALPWSLDAPNLHTLSVALVSADGKTRADTVVVRFGLRVVGKDADARITLNGERVKLHGYNRHNMAPATGAANTLAEIREDLALFEEIGANFLRGGHYPQDQRLLDLCDEKGIAVWEETLGPGVTYLDITSAAFMAAQARQIDEMLDASFNHPSVLFWGFFNEGENEISESCSGYKTCVDAFHARDSSRMVAWASNKLFRDKCIDSAAADLVAFNDYPGWYDHPGNLTYPTYLWNSHAANVAKTWPGRPFLISETACEGLWEWHNESAVIWSQTYQNIILKADVDTALSNAGISGVALWVFADFKGNDQAQDACGPCPYYPGTHDAIFVNVNCTSTWGGNLGNRPCGENHKGTVDWWRRKKEVFPILQKLFKECHGHC